MAFIINSPLDRGDGSHDVPDRTRSSRVRIDDALLRRIVLVVLLATAIAGIVVQTTQSRA